MRNGKDDTDKELEEIRRRKKDRLAGRDGRGDGRGGSAGGPGGGAWPNSPVEVTDGNIGALVGKYPLVVVDCWAPWCGPCMMMGPVIEQLARENAGKAVFGKLNVDNNRRTAGKYNVMSIPTLLVFKGGKLVEVSVGAMPKQMVNEMLAKHVEAAR